MVYLFTLVYEMLLYNFGTKLYHKCILVLCTVKVRRSTLSLILIETFVSVYAFDLIYSESLH